MLSILNLNPTINIFHWGGNISSLTIGGKSVDTIDSQGDNWIRYTNGIQICWGSVYVTTSTSTSPLTSNSKSYYGNGYASFGASFKNDTIPTCTLSCIDIAYGLYNVALMSIDSAKINAELYGGNSGETCQVMYTAIGKWK